MALCNSIIPPRVAFGVSLRSPSIAGRSSCKVPLEAMMHALPMQLGTLKNMAKESGDPSCLHSLHSLAQL